MANPERQFKSEVRQETEAELQKSRTLSDAEKIRDGATYVPGEEGPRLEFTKEQVDGSRREMRGEDVSVRRFELSTEEATREYEKRRQEILKIIDEIERLAREENTMSDAHFEKLDVLSKESRDEFAKDDFDRNKTDELLAKRKDLHREWKEKILVYDEELAKMWDRINVLRKEQYFLRPDIVIMNKSDKHPNPGDIDDGFESWRNYEYLRTLRDKANIGEDNVANEQGEPEEKDDALYTTMERILQRSWKASYFKESRAIEFQVDDKKFELKKPKEGGFMMLIQKNADGSMLRWDMNPNGRVKLYRSGGERLPELLEQESTISGPYESGKDALELLRIPMREYHKSIELKRPSEKPQV